MEILNNWQTWLVLYYVSAVAYVQCFRLSAKMKTRDSVSMVLFSIFAIFFLVMLIPLFPWQLPSDIKLYLLLFLASFFYTVNDRLQTTARKNIEASVISIINQLKTVIMFLTGIFVFKEIFEIDRFFAVCIIIFANILIFYKKGRLRVERNVVIAIIAVVAITTAMMIDVGVSDQFNLPFYLIAAYLIPVLIISGLEKVRVRELVEVTKTKFGKIYIVIGAASALSMVSAIKALQIGDVTVVAPLMSVTVLINVIVAYAFLKERNRVLRKILAAGLIIFAVVILSQA